MHCSNIGIRVLPEQFYTNPTTAILLKQENESKTLQSQQLRVYLVVKLTFSGIFQIGVMYILLWPVCNNFYFVAISITFDAGKFLAYKYINFYDLCLTLNQIIVETGSLYLHPLYPVYNLEWDWLSTLLSTRDMPGKQCMNPRGSPDWINLCHHLNNEVRVIGGKKCARQC